MDVPCTEGKRHLFLTGEKQVGKSTLIRGLVPGLPCPPGGFYTVKAEGIVPGRVSLHLLRGGETPSPSNRLTLCPPNPEDGETIRRFEALGIPALSGGEPWLVMDELGPGEERAIAFRQAVLRTLDSESHVLGVLQKAESAFLSAIARRPDVLLVTVTRENRTDLRELLPRIVKQLNQA